MRHPGIEPAPMKGIRKLRTNLKLDGEKSRGMNGVVEYLEEYRSRSIEDIARVEHFIRELSAKVTIAIAPEIEVGVRDLAALSRVANCLLTPVTLKNRSAKKDAGVRL